MAIGRWSRNVYGLGNLHKTGNGYITRVIGRRHPNADARGRVYEHILIAEHALGRILPPKAQVHHVDKDHANNKNNNLVICEDAAYHRLLHARERAYLATGDPTARSCRMCGKWMLLTDPDTYVYQCKTGRSAANHRSCKATWDKAYLATRVKPIEEHP